MRGTTRCQDFCAKKHAVLLATDVAARGLDFPAIQWVLQADAPDGVATYIHRTGRTARHTASGRALLLLIPSEKAFIPKLAAARVEIKRLSYNTSLVQPLKQKLQALLSQRAELKYNAQRAFVSYVRSVRTLRPYRQTCAQSTARLHPFFSQVHLHSDNTIFDAAKLPLGPIAESYGLLAAPRVRFLSGGKGAKDGARSWDARLDSPALPSWDDEEWQGEAEGSVDSAGNGANFTATAGRKLQPRSKLMRLLSRNAAQNHGGTSFASCVEPSMPRPTEPSIFGDLLTVRHRTSAQHDQVECTHGELMPVARPHPDKIKIRKGGTVVGGKRTVFDCEV